MLQKEHPFVSDTACKSVYLDNNEVVGIIQSANVVNLLQAYPTARDRDANRNTEQWIPCGETFTFYMRCDLEPTISIYAYSGVPDFGDVAFDANSPKFVECDYTWNGIEFNWKNEYTVCEHPQYSQYPIIVNVYTDGIADGSHSWYFATYKDNLYLDCR